MRQRGLACGAVLAVMLLIGLAAGGISLSASAGVAETTSKPVESLHSATVSAGDTLEEIIGSAGASRPEAALVTKAIRSKFDPRDLQPGQKIVVRLGPKTADGARSISAVSIALAKNHYVEVIRDKASKYIARQTSRPLKASTTTASAAPAERAVSKLTTIAKAPGKTTAKAGLTLKIKRGDTIASLLRAQGFASVDAHRASEALKPQIDLRNLKVGQEVTVAPGPRGASGLQLARLVVKQLSGLSVEVVRNGDGNYAQSGSSEPVERLATVVVPKPPVRGAATDKPPTLVSRGETVVLAKGGTLPSLLKTRGYQAADMVAPTRVTALAVEPSMLRWGQASHLGAHELAAPAASAAAADDRESGDAAQSDAGESEPPNHGAGVYIEEQAAPRDAAFRLVVAPGDSVMNLLLREGFDANEIDHAVRALRKAYNPRRLREGQVLTVLTETGADGTDQLAAFTIPVSERRFVEVQRKDTDSFKAVFVREPSYSNRLPPLDAGQAVADAYEETRPNTPVYRAGEGQRPFYSESANDLVKIAPGDPDIDDNDGWSVLSWLGGVGDALGRTGEAAAAAIELSPAPRPNRVLDLEDLTTPTELSDRSREVEISKGETLLTALARGGADPQEAEAVAAAFKKVHSPRRLRVGQTVSLAFDAMDLSTPAKAAAGSGNTRPGLSRVSLSVGPDRDIVVERLRNDRFSAREVERPLVRSVYKATGEITSSFYDSALAAGLSIDVLSQLVQMFSYDVDFQRSLQPGDTFEVLYERTENDRGDVVEQGTVLFAALTVSKERLELFRYEPPDGPADYYDASGKSVRKALLRTPVDGARISSKFGMRKHPILGFTRKHKGVDFAAPSNTPVFAAGDGVIEKIGWFSSYGRYIRVKHNDSYKTAYAHLRGYARGMKAGSKVRQGQVIGYVGSSGRSTGPHLHYEVIKNDTQINPNATKLASGKTLTGKQLAHFQAEMRGHHQMFAQAETITRVARNNSAANSE